MNYVGSISIIDRGDAPAKAIIEKNTRSLVQRVADETKDELNKVMDRVDNIYVSYEMSTQTMFETHRGAPNVEYIGDIKELEAILSDTVKKKKYQQQVTIFVVGFQEVCAQKLQLLYQVNQFFLDNSKLDEEELVPADPVIDLEEASNRVNESLSAAGELAKKLSDINQDIIEWLVNYANNKASNKGKKRLEKNLEAAKNELTDLAEKLLKLQTELEEKDEKFHQVVKQLETKTQEAVRYKTAAEVAKKSAQDIDTHTSALQEEITHRDEKIQELQAKLSHIEINVAEMQFDKDMTIKKGDTAQSQTKEKMTKLQEEVDQKNMAEADTEREMEKLYHDQLAMIEKHHQEEIETLKREHQEEIAKLTEQLQFLHEHVSALDQGAVEGFEINKLTAQLGELEQHIESPHSDGQSHGSSAGKSVGDLAALDDDNTRQESRPSTKDTKSSKKIDTLKPSRTPAKSPNRLIKEKSGKSSKEFSDASIQDEGGNASGAFVEKIPSRQQTRQSKNLEPVIEGERSEFPAGFALSDEESWSTVPAAQVNTRFTQYRQLSRAKITELEEQLQVTLTKTHRKVNSLKSQFNEHKSKWEAERKILIEQVEQAQKLQTDAEKEADAAMTQLEEFINEQEKLEGEEELKRQEIIKTMSRPGTVIQASPVQGQKPPLTVSASDQVTGERNHSTHSEQELNNLMQQTDDAKVQEKSARQYGAISAPPAVEPSDGQIIKLPSQREHSFPPSRNIEPSYSKKFSFERSFSQSQHSVIADEQMSTKKTSIYSGVSLSRNNTCGTSETPGYHVSESQHPLSESQRPISVSSVKPTILQSPPPYLHNEVTFFHVHTETQTDELLLLQHEVVKEHSEEEVRQLSAKSRASLRNHFKTRLDETRHAAEERRTRSPVISIPYQKSIDNELIIEDDDDLPIPDDLKEEALHREDTLEAATSPPPMNKLTDKQFSFMTRISTKLVDHPMVAEYLRVYNGVHNFKEAISRVLVDKDQMSASQLLADLESIPFHKEEKVFPQIVNMSENVYYVLNEVSQVIHSVLQNDRDPMVSSLMMGITRDPTQRTITHEKSTADILMSTRGSQRTESTKPGSASTDRQHFKDLQEQYEKFNFDVKITSVPERQNQMAEETKSYEEQQQHNMVMMMEMQDTINQLQQELSSLGKQTRRPPSESLSMAAAANTDSAIMFTRLDSERNAKIMKRAVNEKKLDPTKYKEAIVQMDEYIDLPAQRLVHLVKKYVHHCRMKEIEENVQKSQSLNENVFKVLDKMEALQNQRAQHWAEKMDEMGVQRYRLASMLMETLDTIEQESGIFLIKPMYSYRGREPVKERFSGKISRPFRPHRTLSPLRDVNSAYAPAPTPASNVRPPRAKQRQDDLHQSQEVGQIQPQRPLEGDTVGLMGAQLGYIGAQSQTTWLGAPVSYFGTWNMAESQMGVGNHATLGNVNTPRILELDINRMMIGQNTISAQIGPEGVSNDRLENAANNNLRSYMTVTRPGPGSTSHKSGPGSPPSRTLSGSRQTSRPSSSPTGTSSTKHVRMSTDVHIPNIMSTGQPLPPIGGLSNQGLNSGSSKGRKSPPRIPVGSVEDMNSPQPPLSSLRQTSPDVTETETLSPTN